MLMLYKLSDQTYCMQAGEKLALKDTTKGDVIVKLVPLIDNFEAAKNSIKVQSDAEQKIVDSYQVGVTERELGSMWTGACALLNRTLKMLLHHYGQWVLFHAALVHALQQSVVCIMQNQQQARLRFAARLKADHKSGFNVMHVNVPHPAKCRNEKVYAFGDHIKASWGGSLERAQGAVVSMLHSLNTQCELSAFVSTYLI